MKKDDEPKYINTGDTTIYNKRYNLYALNMQRGKRVGELIMVEGYMDVISLFAAGIENAVASLGTAMTQQQARLIKRYADKMYLCYDVVTALANAGKHDIKVIGGRYGLGSKDTPPRSVFAVYEELAKDQMKRQFTLILLIHPPDS